MHATPSALYRIVVHGRLPARAPGSLDGAEVRTTRRHTVITGRMVDQAHLYGVIDQLRDMGAHLISVDARRSFG